ncbi:MAG: winged helix-turn-helix domain-containing protein [Spirochaetaceae bacterium]|nr:winged helix-turn-helix domain-containing protein [Spirochaetaceae bacterium]
MAIPDFQSIMLPLLELAQDGQEHRVSDEVETLALRFSLTQDEMDEPLPSGKQPRFRNRVNWAATHLRKAGLLESPRRAHFRITDRGRSVLADAPPKIDIKFLNKFPEFVDFRTSRTEEASSTSGSNVQPDGSLTSTPEEALQEA